MKYFHKKRLLKLADFLDNLPRKNFDIYSYFSQDDECGTVACAAGWATKIKSFRKAGLKNRLFFPTYRGHEAATAITDFFGITSNDFQDIFTIFGYDLWERMNVTPKMVAKKIRKLLKDENIN